MLHGLVSGLVYGGDDRAVVDLLCRDPDQSCLERDHDRAEGDEQEHLKALRALQHAAPYVRKQLGFALNLRHTPALHFVRDTVEEEATRVEALLEGVEKG